MSGALPLPLPDRDFCTLALAVFTATVVFNVATYNYYRGSVVTAFHGGPVSPAKHHLALADGVVQPDGSVRFYAYLNGGTPAEPSNIMAATLLAHDGSVLEHWDGTALSHMAPGMIANDFAYNRFVPGPFGLSAKMGAEAIITLPGKATGEPAMTGNPATLRLRTVNGNSFELPVKAD
jgi:thiosulfate dehydrogenase [quinone] large subunit